VTATEKRTEIMALADMLNTHRRALLDTIGEINKAITELVGAADGLMLAAADEHPQGVKAVKLNYTTREPSPEDIANYTKPKQRCCSNCGQPGHRATTCTNERLEAEIKKQDIPKERKARRPLTEEQKEQKRQILVKARAARGRKK